MASFGGMLGFGLTLADCGLFLVCASLCLFLCHGGLCFEYVAWEGSSALGACPLDGNIEQSTNLGTVLS
jgi:hypothetical protein